jgi:LPS-assembly protein
MKTGPAGGAAAILLLLLACAVPAFAATPFPGGVPSKASGVSEVVFGGPVTMNADSLAYDDNTGVATAEGNIEIGFGNRSIRADRIRYDSRSGEAELIGRVHYKDAGDEFSFDRIVLNIDTELGVLYNGTIRLSNNNYLISSEKFEKTGERTFQIRKGTLTTCPCDPEPDWKFEVNRSRVTLDGYAVGKDVTFKVRGVPVLWLPWAAFPVKLTRQSGFLMPSFSHSGTKGYAFQLPYYWAISRWSDATVTLEDMSRRGLRPEAEYRYVLNPDSEGKAYASFFHDKKADHDRYRFNGINTYRDGGSFTSNVKWDLASDDLYYVELVDDDILRTGRHVPSRGFLAYGGEQGVAAMSAVYVNDVQGTPDDNTVQRLPEFSMTLLPRSFGGSAIEAGGEVSATYFYRRAGDRELRGRGYAEISRSVPLYPSITFTPCLSVDVLGSHPASSESGTEKGGRVLPGGGGKLDADFRRSFEGGAGTRLIHVVQPATSFRWIPAIDQKAIPLTDEWSRVGEQQQFTFSVIQRLLRFDNVTGPYELAYLAVEWALDVGDRRATGSPYIDPLSPFVRSLRDQIDLAAGRSTGQREAASDIYARFQVRPAWKWIVSGEMLFDAGAGRFTTAAIGGEWKQAEESRALLEYRKSRDLAEDVNGLFAVRLHRVLGLKTNVNYSMKNKELTDGRATLTLYPRSDCWSVGLEAGRKTKPDESSYKLLFSLKGIGTIGN